MAAAAAGGSIVPDPAPNMVYVSDKIMIGQRSFLRTAANADAVPPPPPLRAKLTVVVVIIGTHIVSW